MSYTKTEVTRIGLSGGESLAIIDVTPDAATGNITIADAASVKVVGAVTLTEDPAANAQVAVQAKENAITANQIDIKLWKATNDAATAYKAFRLLVKIIR